MTTFRPDQLLSALNALVSGTAALEEYKQLTTDAWNAAYEPFAPDLIPEDIAGLKHLMYYIEAREVGPVSAVGSRLQMRATIDAYAMFMIQTRGETEDGTGAAINSFRQALAGTRHLWYVLADADSSIAEITTLTDEGLTAFRVMPMTVDWHMGHVRIPILYFDTLGA